MRFACFHERFMPGIGFPRRFVTPEGPDAPLAAGGSTPLREFNLVLLMAYSGIDRIRGIAPTRHDPAVSGAGGAAERHATSPRRRSVRGAANERNIASAE